jgi:putative membrane protein
MRIFVAVAVSALLAGPAVAQSAKEDAGTTEFVDKAATSDMFEIASSKLALDRGNEATKAFAQQMVTDHTKTTSELKGLVDSGKVAAKPPAEMSKAQAAKLKKLESMKGSAFDKQYDSDQLAAHKEAVGLFKRYGMSGKNPDLKSWAAQTEPALEHHLDMAKELKP